MKYHNSVLFSTLDIVRVLTALVVLFFVFKMKPNFNIKLFGVYAILVFVFYQYGVFFGHFLLSWPL